VIVLDKEPEERPVSDTVTLPERLSVDVLAEAFTVIVLPLVETVIQLASLDVVNVPSVLTITVFEPPSGSKVRLSGETVMYLPSCVTVTLAEPALFWIVTVPVRLLVVLFSAMDRVRFALPEPEVDDNVIHEASLDAFHAAFEVIETLFEAEADVTEMLEGETDGATTLVPLCVTVISLLSEPEDRFDNDTITLPERSDVLVLAEAFTVMVLPLVETVIQSALSEVVNEPSVLTVTFFEPPPASNETLSGETVRYLPFCVTVTLAEPALFWIVTVPVRLLVVLFSAMDRVRFALLEPLSDDSVIHDASFDAVQSAFDVIEMLFEVAAEVTEILVGDTVGTSTLAPFCVTVMVRLSEPEERFVSDTVTVPVRFEVLVLADAVTLMVLPLVETVIQLASLVVVNVPSVLTLTDFVPPVFSNERLSGDTVRYLPSCATVTLAVPALF